MQVFSDLDEFSYGYSPNIGPALGPAGNPIHWVPFFFRDVKVTDVHVVPRLRMSGAIPLFPLYAFVLRGGKCTLFTGYNSAC